MSWDIFTDVGCIQPFKVSRRVSELPSPPTRTRLLCRLHDPLEVASAARTSQVSDRSLVAPRNIRPVSGLAMRCHRSSLRSVNCIRSNYLCCQESASVPAVCRQSEASVFTRGTISPVQRSRSSPRIGLSSSRDQTAHPARPNPLVRIRSSLSPCDVSESSPTSVLYVVPMTR